MSRAQTRIARWNGWRTSSSDSFLLQGIITDGPSSERGKSVHIPLRSTSLARKLAAALVEWADLHEEITDTSAGPGM
jgi:hypothetical protein